MPQHFTTKIFFSTFRLTGADKYVRLVVEREKDMLGKVVMCRVKSANETKSVYGTIVKRCDSPHVFVLKLSQPVDFYNGKMYTYPKNSTMLVTQSEIVR